MGPFGIREFRREKNRMSVTAPSPLPANVRRGAYLLFLLSGASGLIFETLWSYQATLALGSSSAAITAVLSAFMAGLALGNLLALRRSVWSMRTYALLELVILVSGVAALGLLPALGGLASPLFRGLAGHPALLNGLRFVLAFGVLVVPATAMGMTLPALAQALGGEQGAFRGVLGRLYGLNTLGAIAGVLGAETVLLPAIGVFGTGACAAVLNGAAAAGAWRLSRRPPSEAAPAETAWDRKIPRGLLPVLLPALLAGFALLGLEVIWTRFLSLFITNSSLAFALMLATVLLGIALGGIAGGMAWIRRPFAFLLLLGAGAATLACYAAFPLYQPSTATRLVDIGSMLQVGFFLQFPVSFLSGAFFTLAGAELRERIPSSQASAGLLVLFNTLGAAAGAIVAGFVFVPSLGVEKSFVAVSLVYGAAAGLWSLGVGGNRRWMLLGAAAWILSLVLYPFGRFQNVHVPAAVRQWNLHSDLKIEAVREGLTETIVYVRAKEFDQTLYTRMVTNSFSMSANAVSCDRYMKQFVYWPVALHPAPRRALLICFGVGSTARALARTRELDHIDVVDLSRDVLAMSPVIFPDPASHPLNDPRVTVHVEDGRFFLQTRPDTWDIITGEPPPPELPGVAGLYSREYFQLLKDRLSEGGIATYWLPIHSLSEPASRSILKAWSDVFETCFLWRGANLDLMLTGFRGRPNAVSEARFLAQWKDPATLGDLAELGFELPETLGTGFVGDGDYIRSLCAAAAPTADGFPKRIVAPEAGEKGLYAEWFNLPACADRFKASASLASLWPPELKSRTLPYFLWEGTLSTLGTQLGQRTFPDFSKLHLMLTSTPLRSPAAWMLESNRDYVQAVERCAPELRQSPRAQFHLGARALAERDYARASEHFLRTVGVPEMRRVDLAACLYALCLAGRKDDAEKTLARVWDETKMKAIPPSYWAWMKATFDLRIPPESGKSR
jgi:predicted membrane-bound spermidine synthase